MDLSTLHSYLWIFNASDLSLIDKARVDCHVQDMVLGDIGQLVISHDPPGGPAESSITIFDTINDVVVRDIVFTDIGFPAIVYDQNTNMTYGVINQMIWTGEYDYVWEYTTDIGRIDLSDDSLTLIPIGSEILGPAIALSPDGSRIYIPSYESDKIYYIDL